MVHLRLSNHVEMETDKFINDTKPIISIPGWKAFLLRMIDDQLEVRLNRSSKFPTYLKRCILRFQHAHYLLCMSLVMFCIVQYNHSAQRHRRSVHDSYGLINVPNSEWDRIRSTFQSTKLHQYDKALYMDDPNVWYQYN
jgi:hypothetical protein